MNNYRTIQQKDMHKLFPAWEHNIPTLGNKYSQPGNKTALRLALSLLLMFVLGSSVWAQTKVPDGIYYIQNNSSTHGYLWPSLTTNTTTGYRYLTTSFATSAEAVNNVNGVSYTAHDKSYSHWVVKNVTGGYIQLINPKLNKYVVIRKFPKDNNTKENEYGDRDVWLTDEPTADDIYYSYFVLNNANSPYKISPKAGLNDVNTTSGYSFNSATGSDRVWLTCSKKDDNQPRAEEDREGLIQLYSGGTPLWSFTSDLLDAPTISVPDENNKVTITDANSLPLGYEIRYTTDGYTNPTATTGEVYSEPIPITASVTIKAVVVRYGMVLTEVASETREPAPCATPVITYDNTTSEVSITCSTLETTIRYTIDGTDPTISSTLFTPFTVSSPTTVKAIATHADFPSSAVAELAISQVATPTIQDNGSNAISIATTTSDATIYYTIDGSDPTTSSTEYTEPLTDNVSNVTIKAIAVKEGMITSAVGSGSVKLQCAAPVISFNDVTSEVSISCDTEGSTIRYTTDGETPTESSSVYSNPFSVSSATTVKAITINPNYVSSTVTEFAIPQVATPTIQNNGSNAISITTTTSDATIYYTTDSTEPTTSSIEYTDPLNDSFSGVTIKAIAVKAGMITSAVGSGLVKLQCATPVITREGLTFTLSCSKPIDAKLYYTLGGGSETLYSEPVAFTADQLPITVTAVARHDNYTQSETASMLLKNGAGTPEDPYLIYGSTDFSNFITNVNNGGDYASASYKLGSDVSASGVATITTTFNGTLEAAINPETQMPYRITNLSAPLFTTLTGTVRNIVLESVGISGHAGNTGAIACTANDAARIYNVGILSGSVGGTGNTGGLVGLLDGTARVINCYSYADITGGTEKGGIVGNNNKTSNQGAITTMVMNCMFYGDIADGNTIAPIYGGTEITNASGGLPNYNFYRYRSRYSIKKKITKYNCALAMEEKFINRFERYRLLLNSNKKLAAWYITGDATDTAKLAKWVLEMADRTNTQPKPYPILKAQGKYPSIINYDAKHVPDSAAVGRFKGGRVGTLAVAISGIGDNASSLAKFTKNRTSVDTTLVITDKDEDRFNFNYKKVQLPYFNEMGEGNCTKNRVVTGWEITGFTGRTSDTFDTGDKWGAYNFADRDCTSKDLYSKTGRVFSQGAYYDVPNGVTGITIKPHWATAAYVADNKYDVAYSNSYVVDAVDDMGTQATNNGFKIINGDSQKVYTSVGNARASMEENGTFAAGATVYDYAVVLVGNVHQNTNPTTNNTPYTIMSIDENKDNEPDYTYIFAHDSRKNISPIRFDFLNIMGIAEAQLPKNTDSNMKFRNVSIFKSKGWLEITNTCVVNFSQLEYDDALDKESGQSVTKAEAPVILLGGTYEQIVSTNGAINNKIQYVHIGSNAWFAKFGPGTHSDGSNFTKHVPVSVTGGDYDEFYLTGTYQPTITNMQVDSAECYISGGRFGEMAGASLELLKGSVRWDINYADITNFYGGGVNGNNPVEGNIRTDIANSHVERFCGGPKFGDMSPDKTVTTNATNCTFGTFFGAGFGGNSYNRVKYRDVENGAPANYQGCFSTDRGNYFDGTTTNAYDTKPGYGKKGKGVATDFDYEYFVWSSGSTGARFFVKFITFSLAKTNNVKSTLTKCTVNNNFYGGGSLGKVLGTATSILDGCTVNGNVFGGGYSATIPKIEVRNTPAFKSGKEPSKNINIGMFEEGEIADSVIYEWKQVDDLPNNGASGMESTSAGKFVYTDEDLTSLGQVGTVNLTIKGNTNVAGKIEDGINTGGNVYGGGEESNVLGDTRVNMNGGTIAQNVFGGGKGVADEFACSKAMIGIEGEGANNENPEATKDKGTKVSISDGTVNGNVYGGGEVGRVEWNTQVTIGEENGTGTPVINGCVYGAGKGLKTHGYAALVRGNPTVTIQGNAKIKKSVYGGGEIASVARYKVATTAEEAAANGVEIDMPYALANNYSGNCKVIVGGNAIIGPDEPMKMYHPEITDGTDTPDDFGHVFAAGKGVLPEVYTYEDNAHRPKRMLLYNAESLPTYWEYADEAQKNIWEYFKDENAYFAFIKTLALSSKTEVTIKDNAFVKGSVYGGSENGLVQFDTDVKIQGGQIGCGKNATAPYGDDVWANEYTPSDDLECASWDYGKDTNDDGKKDQFAPYDPYAKYLNPVDKKYYYDSEFTKYAEGGANIATDGHTYYGNVFGGGSGSVPYLDTQQGVSRYVSSAGMVKGNTKVTISGGHILTNVYGGCEATDVLGSATITMTGGTVGVPRTLAQIVAHPVTCYIFGAGKGDQRIFFNKETNVDRTTVSIEGGKVYGSIFGGGEDGHVFQNTTVNIGTTEGEGPTIGTLGTSYVDGNVFGGGRGFGGDALTAGNIGGSVELNIKSGKILGSVYGGGRLASVGYGLYLTTEEGYGILRPDDQYDGSYTNPSTQDASVYYDKGRGYITINISGGTIGNDLEYIYNPTTGQKAAIPNTTFDYQNHLQYTKGGNVFTGGMGRLYALDNTTLLPIWSKLGKCKGTTLNMTGGTVKSSIYGGGEIGAVAENATVNINGGTVGTKVVDSEDATKYYYFGSVFGGGKGSTANVEGISEAGTTGGNVTVKLNETVASNDEAKGAIVHQVFGCNDMNGSPKGTVTVHVYATQTSGNDNISTKPTKGTETFDVEAVYGGGNLAAYEPTNLETGKTNVIIDGCGKTSIRQVYGGGNAASTPATDVVINGTYEILELFGGGNGYDKLPDGKPNPGANVGYKNYTVYEKVAEEWVAKDDPDYDTKEERTAGTSGIVYGTGQASINVFGGTVHRVFGGSNTKGNVRKTAVTLLDENSGCPFCVDEAYGGGKSAPMDAEAKLLMACIPGLSAAYGGAEAAAIQGNVTLNITNGTFDRVFGGNNLSGTINGSITVNVEEVGCKPIMIGELYGGGNQAGYSVYGYDSDGKPVESGTTPLYNDPQVNVKSFTSIGNIFGGGYGSGATMVGNPTVNINEVYGRYYNDDRSVVSEDVETPNHYPIPSHAKGKMGAINNVFGGGNAAKVIGNTNVNIGTLAKVSIRSFVEKTVTVGTSVEGLYTRSGEGTEESPYTYIAATGTAVEGTKYYEEKDVENDVIGADIRGNVYGGGNEAEVTGDTNVNIGKKSE